MPTTPDWLRLNRANWNERVPIHLNASGPHYNLEPLRRGQQRLDTIAADILGPVAGLRVLHLQCHFGYDSLVIAQQGATVTGLDFSEPAITAANSIAIQLGLTDRARFVEANVYDAAAVVGEPGTFDRVLVSWGALCWLPDVAAWARVVASFLKPGGYLALADAHPAAYVFDDRTATPDGRPGWFMPYLAREPMLDEREDDYADPDARLQNTQTVEFLHPLADVIMGLIDAGLRIDQFHEHDSVVWQMFASLQQRGQGHYAWPDKPWLPLSYSLRAAKPHA